jgi:eukaryotic-like serine/threonine-protein kinase
MGEAVENVAVSNKTLDAARASPSGGSPSGRIVCTTRPPALRDPPDAPLGSGVPDPITRMGQTVNSPTRGRFHPILCRVNGRKLICGITISCPPSFGQSERLQRSYRSHLPALDSTFIRGTNSRQLEGLPTMAAPSVPPVPICFGSFEADLQTGELRKRGVPVRLQQKPFQILAILLERPGGLVTREELRKRLWGDETFVDFDNSLNTAIAKLREALGDSPDRPRFLETLPRKGYRFIFPVSAGSPALATVFPVVRSAVEEVAENAPPAPTIARPRRFQKAAVAGAILLLAMAAILANRIFSRNSRGRVVPQVHGADLAPHRSVAVVGFQNVTGQTQDAWLSTAISEVLSTELAAGTKLRLIPGEDVTRMKRELRLEQAGSLGRETAAQVGKNLGVELLVVGSYTAMGRGPNRRLRLDLRLQDTATGEILSEVGKTGAAEHLFEIVSQAAARLRQQLGVSVLSESEEASVRASSPTSPEAARFYAEGLARLRRFDALGARDLLEQAVAVEPNYPLSHVALASAWTILGYERRAKEEAKNAVGLSSNLPRVDQLVTEGRYYEINGETEKAIAAYRALYTLAPDNLDFGLMLADAQVDGGKTADALKTLDTLRRLPGVLSRDSRIDLQEAFALGKQGDNFRKLEAARHAVEGAKSQNALLLMAMAGVEECHALKGLGQLAEAANACEDSRRILLEAGDRAGAARAERLLGDIRYAEGRLSEAVGLYRRVLKAEQTLGMKKGMAVTLNEMALVSENQGDLREALKLYRDSLRMFLEVGNQKNASVLAGNVAGILLAQGKLTQSRQWAAKSLDLAQGAGAKTGEAPARANLGLLALARGKPSEARAYFEEALALYKEVGEVYDASVTLRLLGDSLAMQADVAGARKKQAEALIMEEKIGAMGLAAESHLAIAQLDTDVGQAAQAEQNVGKALEVFRNEKMREDELQAYIVLSRCLVMQDKLAEAEAALKEARAIATRSQNPAQHIRLAIAEALVRIATSKLQRRYAINSRRLFALCEGQ